MVRKVQNSGRPVSNASEFDVSPHDGKRWDAYGIGNVHLGVVTGRNIFEAKANAGHEFDLVDDPSLKVKRRR